MKNKFYRPLLFSALILSSCSKSEFAADNTNPDQIQVSSIDVRSVFPTAAIAQHLDDFEAYYDNNRNIPYWVASWVPLGGMGTIITRFTTPISASSNPYRYENLYSRETTGVGGAMTDMRHQIDAMAPAKSSTYADIRAISYIPMAYSAFFLSDIVGSIAYSNAFQARYTTPPALTPTYDTQEALFDTLNNQLKASVAVLKANQSSTTQVLLGTFDLYYHGVGNEATNWAMAANALRLKIAMRMLKRKPDAAKAIITEVLADNIGPVNSRASQWVFKAGSTSAYGGNWAISSTLSGQKNVIDFMYQNSDPRMRNMYQACTLTQAQFTTLQAAKTIPATEAYQTYRGRYASPDAASDVTKSFYFNYVTGSTPYVSYIQFALFDANIGKGMINFPIITYADVCFMRAELAAKGITTETASDWYYKGIDASLADYDQWGNDAKVAGYTAITAAEMAAYKTKPGIAYSASTGLEQIYVQQYINSYKNMNEKWALMKRTGYPSPTGVILQGEVLKNSGVTVVMPRRWSLSLPVISDFNYTNKLNALQDMQKDAQLGTLSDITGRVWWDMP